MEGTGARPERVEREQGRDSTCWKEPLGLRYTVVCEAGKLGETSHIRVKGGLRGVRKRSVAREDLVYTSWLGSMGEGEWSETEAVFERMRRESVDLKSWRNRGLDIASYIG